MSGQGPSHKSLSWNHVEQEYTDIPPDEKRRPAALNLTQARKSSTDSSSSYSSLQKPRTPRFAEATSVHSPVDGPRPPFAADSEKSYVAQAQPGDIGFGYINNQESIPVPMTPKTPLKSAMKVPGTPGRRFDNPMSPTFRQQDMLEKREAATDKEQERDLVCSRFTVYFALSAKLTTIVESQDASSYGEGCPSWSQLQLCSHHPRHAFGLFRHF